MSRRTTLRLLLVGLWLAAAINVLIVIAFSHLWPANLSAALVCVGMAAWLHGSEP